MRNVSDPEFTHPSRCSGGRHRHTAVTPGIFTPLARIRAVPTPVVATWIFRIGVALLSMNAAVFSIGFRFESHTSTLPASKFAA